LSGQGFGTVGADSGSIAFGHSTSHQGRIYQDNSTSDFFIENTYSSGDIAIKTNTGERLRITSAGNVGIGTASPADKLNISGGGLLVNTTSAGGVVVSSSVENGSSQFSTKNSNVSTPAEQFYVGNNLVHVDIGNKRGDLKFFTGTTERLRIDDSNGNVGIGITTPGYPLEVKDSQDTNFDSGIAVTRSAAAHSGYINMVGGSLNINVDDGRNIKFRDGGGSPNMTIGPTGDVDVAGALSKGSGSFKIAHPLESKRDTHNLVHSFLEGPQADLLYRGHVDLVDGVASVNIDTASGMTDGTFVLLCRDVQSFTTNESGWTAVRSSVDGNILTIEAQDNTCTDSISWMVVGERQDQHMYDTEWTDETGKVVVEPLIPEPEPEPEEEELTEEE